MKILFLHAWQGVPGGVKVTFLAQMRSSNPFQLRDRPFILHIAGVQGGGWFKKQGHDGARRTVTET
jgi:hypothetical protein